MGTSVFRVTAADPDLGISGVITYSMLVSAGLFSLIIASNFIICIMNTNGPEL